jgi:hypothetical protein
MARRDVEQGVVRQDEVRLHGAQRSSQGRVHVEGRPGWRGRGVRPSGEQQQRECKAGGLHALAVVLLAVSWAAGCAAPREAPLVATVPARLDVASSLPSKPFCPRIAHILVRKSEHQLVARCDPGPVIVMRVALGRAPVGTKLARGDQRTPEGNYRVSGPARVSRFHRLIPIDYPSRRDADSALASGTITAREHARIVARRAHDRPPPQNTALGGHLGLHGEGSAWQGESAGLDWTYGCIAVRDQEIDFLAERVRRGTPVWIQP